MGFCFCTFLGFKPACTVKLALMDNDFCNATHTTILHLILFHCPLYKCRICLVHWLLLQSYPTTSHLYDHAHYGLETHDNDGFGTLLSWCAPAVADRTLGLDTEQEARPEAVDVDDTRDPAIGSIRLQVFVSQSWQHRVMKYYWWNDIWEIFTCSAKQLLKLYQ